MAAAGVEVAVTLQSRPRGSCAQKQRGRGKRHPATAAFWGIRDWTLLTLLRNTPRDSLGPESRAGRRPAPVLAACGRVLCSVAHCGRVLCSVAHSCLTLSDPVDCSLPGSSVHGILQARVLEWDAMPSSMGSSQPRDQTRVFRIAGGFFPFVFTAG